MRNFSLLVLAICALIGGVVLVHAQSYPPSTGWWQSEPKCSQGSTIGGPISFDIVGSHCDVLVVKKSVGSSTVAFADWIVDGLLGTVIAGDSAVIVATGSKDDVVYLYGITNNGKVVIGFPQREYAQGRRTFGFLGDNQGVMRNPDVTDLGRRYCFTGKDWIQGADNTSCDPEWHTALVALRAQGEGRQIVRVEYHE
jgi:hypothetical protein